MGGRRRLRANADQLYPSNEHTNFKMIPHRNGGGIARPGHGDVDLEALQDAFLRGAQKPSATVVRSNKPPVIKSKTRASITPGDSLTQNITEREAPAAPRPMSNSTASATSPLPLPTQRHGGGSASFNASADEKSSTSLQAPVGGMVLDAPGVVSSVSEREVRAPAPMRMSIGVGGTGGGSGSGLGKGRSTVGGEGNSTLFRGGGFPAVRHRSEMGMVRLGGSGANKRQPKQIQSHESQAGAVRPGANEHDTHDMATSVRGGIPADIHDENLARVSSMSPQEVEEAQQEIRSALTPAALEMLMRRGRANAVSKRRNAEGAGTVRAEDNQPSSSSSETTAKAAQRHGNDSVRDMAATGTIESVGAERSIKSGTASVDTIIETKSTSTGSTTPDETEAHDPEKHLPDSTESIAAGDVAGDKIKLGKNATGGGRGLPGGAPTGAQRAATAAGGIDSEEALAAALRSLPEEERTKSLWMASAEETSAVNGNRPGDEHLMGVAGVVRVDLEGVPIPRAGAVERKGRENGDMSNSALYHHGDDPGMAGYTPAELVRLARSTVSGQRQLALRALAGVLRGRAACIARGDAPPHRCLPEMLPVTIRMCLDDGNPSVANAAWIAVEAFIAPLANELEEEEESTQGLSWLDYQAFPAHVRPLCTSEEEALLPEIDDEDPSAPQDDSADRTSEQQEQKSAAELARLCCEDPCRGMIEMGLLPRLRSTIRLYGSSFSATPLSLQAVTSNGGERDASAAPSGAAAAAASALSPRAALACLRTAIALARRAPWTAARVAVEPDLLDDIREVFMEPRADGSLPIDLRDAQTRGPQSSRCSTRIILNTAASRVASAGPDDAAVVAGASSNISQRLALLAERLTRALVQSSREVAIRISRGPLLGSTKGILALGHGLRGHPDLPLNEGLVAAQREMLELWRACLSYGIDVASADTVALISREQGWWPEPTPALPPNTAASMPDGSPVENHYDTSTATGVDDNKCTTSYDISSSQAQKRRQVTSRGPDENAAGELTGSGVPRYSSSAVPEAEHRGLGQPSVSLYRALHQLACACVLPKSANRGSGGMQEGEVKRRESDEQRTGQSFSGSSRGDGMGSSVVVIGGISVDVQMLAEVGDMVDSAVEAALLWLLGMCRDAGELARASMMEAASIRAVQAAAIHLIACWVERHSVMSRTADRRGARQLASIVDDAAVLLSFVLASPTLVPAAVFAAAKTASGIRETGLDWLSALFRLGLACEQISPGESEAALTIAPESTTAALASFLSASPSSQAVGVAHNQETRLGGASRSLGGVQTRRARRALASARLLGCRFLACLGDDVGVRQRDRGRVGAGEGEGSGREKWRSWSALRRDCALQSVALCWPGDEAVAVGLVTEALPDAVGSKDKDENPEAAAVLRKIFRGAISDPVALSQASFHLDGRWASLQSLRACAPLGSSSLLPLPRHWLMLPLASQGGENAAAAAVAACLSVLVRLEQEQSAYVVDVSSADSPFFEQNSRLASSPSRSLDEAGHGSAVGKDSLGVGGILSPEVKLYHLTNACMYGAAVLSGESTEENFDWLLTRYLAQCEPDFEGRFIDVVGRLAAAAAPDPSKIIANAASMASSSSSSSSSRSRANAVAGKDGEKMNASDRARVAREQAAEAGGRAEHALLEFVKDLTGSFLADSFGLSSFARVLRIFLRTGFPATVRCVVWKELGAVGLLSLLDPSPRPSTEVCDTDENACNGGEDAHSWAEAYLNPPDVDKAIIDAYLTALEHPRFATPPKSMAAKGSSGEDTKTAQERLLPSTSMTMRSVAVHHLACYFFPPSPASRVTETVDPGFAEATSAAKPALGAATDTGPTTEPDLTRESNETESSRKELMGRGTATTSEIQSQSTSTLSWRPDFGRRKRFQRMLLIGSQDQAGSAGNVPKVDEVLSGLLDQPDTCSPASVAESVLGHRCSGAFCELTAARVSYSQHAQSTGAMDRRDENAVGAKSDTARRGFRPVRKTCLWTPELGPERCRVVQAYCFEGGGSVVGDEDIVEWLGREGRMLGDVVGRLRSSLIG